MSQFPAVRRPWIRALCVALVAALALPLPVRARVDNLPQLGDASVDELSPANERRLGEQIMRALRRDATVSDDVEIADYLNRLASRLVAGSAADGVSVELFLVQDTTLNAFALPGGFIGVHSGLITAAQSESELASVLAHEIGHVTQRHIARMLAQQRQSSTAVLAAMLLAALAARSNPQAVVGVASMASGAQQQRMLAFSRDAEREADRVGLETLRQADFDPGAMVAFFGRLQQSTRLYESNAPAYMRSHPVTAERIADLRDRLQTAPYRQRADSLEFRLARARLRGMADTSVDGLRAARAQFEQALRDGTTIDPLAAWFGIAAVALAQRDFSEVERALVETRRRLTQDHPFVERLAAQARLLAGDAPGALAIASAASARFAGARALEHLRAEAMLANGDFRKAADFLEDQIRLYRGDATVWRQIARARDGLGQPALAHRASAEAYALGGGTLAAIEQLKLAQKASGADFYAASQIDARIRELQAEYSLEQQERALRR